MASLIRIAATVGDPTSIGPEVAATAIFQFLEEQHSRVKIHLFTSRALLAEYSSLALIRKFEKTKQLLVHDSGLHKAYKPGSPSFSSSERAVDDLAKATDLCLSREADVLVTGPLDKHLISKVDPEFRGHTEYLQHRTNVEAVTMLLAGPELKVTLVTTHIPLKEVSRTLSVQKILKTIRQTNEHFSIFKSKPKIAVLGLNPHASDQGLFGDEEEKIIRPALERAKAEGIQAEGPFPPDSFFHRAAEFDVVVCMYHDQGLIPLKMKHFYDAVNITLGLPFLRVSVDHGTAFDIAGKGKASNLSYVRALEYGYSWGRRESIRTVATSRTEDSSARRSRAQSQGRLARHPEK